MAGETSHRRSENLGDTPHEPGHLPVPVEGTVADTRRRRSVNFGSAGEYPSYDFWSRQSEERWANVLKRSIVVEKPVTLGNDGRLPIETMFGTLGWTAMLSTPLIFYPKIVRYFYCNLRKRDHFEHGLAVMSYVRGYKIHLNPSSIGSMLNVPDAGMEWDFTNEPKSIFRFVDRGEILNCICARAGGNRQPTSSDLTPLARVVLKIVNCNILPKGGHREAVPWGYAYVIYCIIKGIQLNLPHLMISFVLYCTLDAKNPHTLPYPALMSSLLTKYGVPILSDEGQDIKSKIDMATLTRMRISLPADEALPIGVGGTESTLRTTRPSLNFIGQHSESACPGGNGDNNADPDPAEMFNSGTDGATGLREEVLAMKERQNTMKERITRIGTAQEEINVFVQEIQNTIFGDVHPAMITRMHDMRSQYVDDVINGVVRDVDGGLLCKF